MRETTPVCPARMLATSAVHWPLLAREASTDRMHWGRGADARLPPVAGVHWSVVRQTRTAAAGCNAPPDSRNRSTTGLDPVAPTSTATAATLVGPSGAFPTTTPSWGAVAVGERVHQPVAVTAGGDAATTGPSASPHPIVERPATDHAAHLLCNVTWRMGRFYNHAIVASIGINGGT